LSATATAVEPEPTRLALALLLWMSILSTLFVTLAPSLVGALSDRLGFSTQQVGYVVAAQLAGSGAGVVIGLLLWNGAPPRSVAVVLVLAMTLADLGSTVVTDPLRLIAIRGAAGIPAGLMFASVNAIVAQLPRPAPLFAAVTGAQMLFGIIGYLALPALLSRFGMSGVFLALAGCSLVCLPLLPSYPSDRGEAAHGSRTSPVLHAESLLILGSLLANYVANNAVWTYLDRIGITLGLTPNTVTGALVASMLGGAIGSAAAIALSTSPRPQLLMSIGVATLAASCAFLLRGGVPSVYVGAVVTFTGGMLFALPFYLASLAILPHGERLAEIATLVIFLGLALGPFLGGQLVEGSDFRPLIWSAVGLFLIAALLAWGAMLLSGRRSVRVE
jgi:predicted MFS family arabinose efflux permease